jgi:hypothetical protein
MKRGSASCGRFRDGTLTSLLHACIVAVERCASTARRRVGSQSETSVTPYLGFLMVLHLKGAALVAAVDERRGIMFAALSS